MNIAFEQQPPERAAAERLQGGSVAREITGCETLTEQGYLGPVKLLTPSTAHWLARHLRRTNAIRPPDWHKARAVIDPVVFRLARSAAIVERLRPVLGPDIILWSAEYIAQRPGRAHRWHVDIESATAPGPTASVWVGLRNVSARSGLTLIPGTHLSPTLLQQYAAEAGLSYFQLEEEKVLDWARQRDQDAAILFPDMTDGEALFFDGRLWHSSSNRTSAATRDALLLQYAPAEVAIRMPDPGQLQWPFRLKVAPKPPSILVSGRSQGMNNRIVPPPPLANRDSETLTTVIHPYRLPLAPDPETGWKPYHAFRGQTGSLELVGCHTAVLSPGHCPHPPHAHAEEEVLIVLDGEAEVLIAKSPKDHAPRIERLGRFQMSYYPAYQHHTIRNVSDRPVTYLMLRWRGDPSGAKWPLQTTIFDVSGSLPNAQGQNLAVRQIVDDPTGLLSTLHIHTSEMQPGFGYEPHVDAYDAAILVLEGEIDILDGRAAANDIVFIAAGEPHGIHNTGDAPARYLVFELHRNAEFMRDRPAVIRKALRLQARGRRFAGRALRKAGRMLRGQR